MTLDEMNYSEGTAALVSYLTEHGWTCTLHEAVGFWTCKHPGTGIELLLPSPNKQTGKISLTSRIVALKGE